MSRQKADRKYHLKKKYGITEVHYEAMLRAQNGCCAICQKPPRRVRLAVDHNHKTGRIRGLLCTYCNKFVLGMARGWTPTAFRRAADYLESPPGVPWGEVGPPPMRVKSDRAGEKGVLKRLKTKTSRRIRGII